MHLGPEGGEPLGVVAAQEEVAVLVGGEAKNSPTTYLDGEELRVGEPGRRAALANATILEILDALVDEAEAGRDEGAKARESEDPLYASAGLGATERGEVSLFIRPCRETCTRG